MSARPSRTIAQVSITLIKHVANEEKSEQASNEDSGMRRGATGIYSAETRSIVGGIE